MLAELIAASAMTSRAPAYPLVVHTPFLSCWSMAPKLTDRWPQHWTQSNQAMWGALTINGKAYRWMGPDALLPSGPVPAMEQVSAQVTATRTLYVFRADNVELSVEFCSPVLVDDMELLARPATYLTIEAKSTDGVKRDVRGYLDFSAEWVVQDASQSVVGSRYRVGGKDVLSFRADRGNVLGRSGDWMRIDWGSLIVAAPGSSSVAGHYQARQGFLDGKVPDDDLRFPRAASDNWPVLSFQMDMNRGPQTAVISYDEDRSIEWLGRRLRPYWNRNNTGPGAMIATAMKDAKKVRERAAEFDAKFAARCEAAGGKGYADIMALSYRQCLGGHGLVEDIATGLMMISKENTSNGCAATVDVTFPASPFFLALAPELLKAQLNPVFDYAASSRWRFPFAPHDLGTYPLLNGQVYGGGERTEENQMPVEESANMLLMAAGICRKDGSYAYASKHLDTMKKWATFLMKEGLDPANQLSTDDFTGHLARNANLSIKAIVAVRAYAEMASGLGKKAEGDKARKWAESAATTWQELAKGGEPTVLAFGASGTWSLKYNLLWDKLLGYKLFPASVYQAEIETYKRKANAFGTPLDNRADFTKTDWLLWVAALADNRADFEKLFDPVRRWVSETPDMVPLTDWYDTKTGRTKGMYARTVIGGLAAKLLVEEGLPPAPSK